MKDAGSSHSHEDSGFPQSHEGLGSSQSHGDLGSPLSLRPILAHHAGVQRRVSGSSQHGSRCHHGPGMGWCGSHAVQLSPGLWFAGGCLHSPAPAPPTCWGGAPRGGNPPNGPICGCSSPLALLVWTSIRRNLSHVRCTNKHKAEVVGSFYWILCTGYTHHRGIQPVWVFQKHLGSPL